MKIHESALYVIETNRAASSPGRAPPTPCSRNNTTERRRCWINELRTSGKCFMMLVTHYLCSFEPMAVVGNDSPSTRDGFSNGCLYRLIYRCIILSKRPQVLIYRREPQMMFSPSASLCVTSLMRSRADYVQRVSHPRDRRSS